MKNPNYALYIAGMDMNVDLIRCAVYCIRHIAKMDCKIYVGVESHNEPIEDAILLHCEPGMQWTGRTRAHLSQISEDKILMILEDYFFEKVDHVELLELCEKMERYKAGVIKLHAMPKPDYGMAGQVNLGFFIPGKKLGRTNTQPALWDRSFLQALLYEDESLWEFEINGAVRSSALTNNILGVYRHVVRYDEVVKRGKFRNRYHSKYKALLQREGIIDGRGFLDQIDECKFEIAHHFNGLLQKIIPQHMRTLLRQKLGL